MKFTKMHGAGNDFVVVNSLTESVPEDLAPIARRVCDRRFGIGADGLMIVERGTQSRFFMRLINADGSEAEMCGNGIRCFAKYIHDNKLADDLSQDVETLAGVKHTTVTEAQGRTSRVKVDMGEPGFARSAVPMGGDGPADRVVGERLIVDGHELALTCLSMGIPHCVIFVDDAESFPVREIGPKIEYHELFPRRTNVDFVQVLSKNELKVRVWERGVGETLACGTGACASTVAAHVNGLADRDVTVKLSGGDLKITWTPEGNVQMDGPAEEVFTGDYPEG